MKRKPGILILLAGLAVMTGLAWTGIYQLGITTLEADSINLHSIFSPKLFCCCHDSTQVQLETTRFIFLGIGLMSVVLLFGIASRFDLRNMASWVILLSCTSIAWVSSFQNISVIAISIFSVLIVQWAFAFIYPKTNWPGIFVYCLICVASVLLSRAADFLIAIHVGLLIIKLISKSRITFSQQIQLLIIFVAFIPFWIAQNKNIPGNLSLKSLLLLCPITVILEAAIISYLLESVVNFINKFKSKNIKSALLLINFLIIAFFIVWWSSFQYKEYYNKYIHRTENNLFSGVNFLNSVIKSSDKLLIVSENPVKENSRLKYYLPDLLKTLPETSVLEIAPGKWNNYHNVLITLTNNRIWVTGAIFKKPNFSKVSKWKYKEFQFAMPIALIEQTSSWSQIEYRNLLKKAVASAPDNIRINREMFRWYINSPTSLLAHCLSAGYAQRDLAANFIHKKLYSEWHHAVINALYAWSEIGFKGYNITNYPAYNNFITATREAGLDIERAVYIYRLYATKMLESGMPEFSAKIAEDSKKLEKENSFIERITAQIHQKLNPEDLEKVEELNIKAMELHEEKFSKTFLDAKYANAILKKKQAEYDDAFSEVTNLLEFVKSGDFIPLSVKTNNTEEGIIQQNIWEQKRIEREGQFNSFIAEVLSAKGDNDKAIEWYTKNTSGKFSRERNLIARRKIAEIYENNRRLKEAYAQFSLLANNSTSVNEKIGFLIDGAQLYVNVGDSITVYDKWLEIKEIIFKLPSEVKSRWLRNKKYQRIVNHLQSRMQLDIREPVMIELSKKAAQTNSGWYSQQLGQLYRCKQQYANAESSFDKGMKKEFDYVENYLDGAMLQYKLLRFKKAQEIFERLEQDILASNTFEFITTDWRYRLLKSFSDEGEPPFKSSLIEWTNNNKDLFENQAKYCNFRGNIYASYNDYDSATNEFHKGINADELYLDNYLDLGYQLCIKNDSENANALLDRILKLKIDGDIKRKLDNDWRFIELNYISVTH